MLPKAAPIYSIGELRKTRFFSADLRTWYGYGSKRAAACARVAAGWVEGLLKPQQERLAEIQRDLGIPTLIPRTALARSLVGQIKVGSRTAVWITARQWDDLSERSRIKVFRAWIATNPKVEVYPRVDLPAYSKKHLQRFPQSLRFKLNHFCATSGPNCLAAALAAIMPGRRASSVAKRWLGEKRFSEAITDFGFRRLKRRPALFLPQDIVVWTRSGGIAHAAFHIGDGFIFEKPGQDFHEPYRLTSLSESSRNFPGAKVEVWRKGAPSELAFSQA